MTLRHFLRVTGANRLPALSVFTGAGGLDLGLEAAGFEILACIEIDRIARATVAQNRPGWRFIGPGDAAAIAPTLRPETFGLQRGGLALLAGGPPCQPFSKAALWAPNGAKGLSDPRSTTVATFLQLLEAFLPQTMIIENVPEFARGRMSTLPVIEAALRRINSLYRTRYRLDSRIINAVDYGVPQRRVRAILVATRDGNAFRWPKPTHADAPVRAWDAIGSVRPTIARCATGRWADLLPSIPEGENYLWHTARGGGTPLFGYRTRYWSFLLKLAKDEPAWTIPAQPGPSTGPFHWDNRPLSKEELLLLQTFSAEWHVEGSYRQQVQQIGNATPPLLGEIFGRAIGAQVFRVPYPHTMRFVIGRAPLVPAPNRLLPLPRRFSKKERTVPNPHPGIGKGPGARGSP